MDAPSDPSSGVLSTSFDALVQHLQLASEHHRLLADVMANHDQQLRKLRIAVESARCVTGGSSSIDGPRAVGIGGTSREALPALPCGSPSAVLQASDVDIGGELPASRCVAVCESSVERPAAQHQHVEVHLVSNAAGAVTDVEVCVEEKRAQQLELLPSWQGRVSTGIGRQNGAHKVKLAMGGRTITFGAEADHRLVSSHYCQRFIVAPSSPKHLCWDMLSLLIVAYDLITLPLQAFGYDSTSMAEAIRPITTVFWTVDIFVSFCSGYHAEGLIEMRPGRILKRYLRSWFIPDFLVVFVDWITFALEGSADVASVGRIGKVARVLRIVRMLRLLRVAKIVRSMGAIADILQNEAVHTTLSMIKLMSALAIGNHFIACIWYAFGETFKGDLPTWSYQLEEQDASPMYMYIVSFHWTISQFTPAPMNYHPRNVYERLFSICLLLFGLIFFASFIGSVTATINQARIAAKKRNYDQNLARLFILQNQVPASLGNRISAFLRQNRFKEGPTRVLESEVELFKALPEALSIQLHYEVYSRILARHPLMLLLGECHHDVIVDVCHVAMSDMGCENGEELFVSGKESNFMFLITAGIFEYRMKSTDEGVEVDPNQWTCELSLWTTWHHVGSLSARGNAGSAILDAVEFRRICSHHEDAFVTAEYYASAFISIVSKYASAGGFVDDLWGDNEQTTAVVATVVEIINRDGLDSPTTM